MKVLGVWRVENPDATEVPGWSISGGFSEDAKRIHRPPLSTPEPVLFPLPPPLWSLPSASMAASPHG